MFDLVLRRRDAAARSLASSARRTPSTTPASTSRDGAVPALLLSLVVIGAGVVTMATRGVPLGIDFSGGTLVIAEFAEQGVTEDAVRAGRGAAAGR